MDKSLVVKANDLINSRYNLGALEQKLLIYSISRIDANDTEMKKVTFNVDDFQKLIGNNKSNRTTEIKQIAVGLMKQVVEIPLKDDGRDWKLIHWVDSAEYSDRTGDITIVFSDDIKPLIYHLKGNFTKYEVKNISVMTSMYSIRLYEVLIQYCNFNGKRFKIENLRDLLGVKDAYPRHYDFERNVIKPAVDEINELTDLNVGYDLIRHRQIVTDYDFYVGKKANDGEVWIEYLKEFYDIPKMKDAMGLENMAVNPSQVMDLYENAVAKCGEFDPFRYIKLNYIAMTEKNDIRSKYGYLLSSIKDDYANAYSFLKLQEMMKGMS